MKGFIQREAGSTIWDAYLISESREVDETGRETIQPCFLRPVIRSMCRSFGGSEEELRQALSKDGEVQRYELVGDDDTLICLGVPGVDKHSDPRLQPVSPISTESHATRHNFCEVQQTPGFWARLCKLYQLVFGLSG